MSHHKSNAPTVYLLRLTDSGAPDVNGGYISLPAPVPAYTLRFTIEGASSICREGKLWINVPEDGKEFERETFHAIPSVFPFSSP